MKILKQNTKNMRTHICTNCNSEIGYWTNELIAKENSNNYEVSLILTCPICGKENVLYKASKLRMDTLRYSPKFRLSDVNILLFLLSRVEEERETVKEYKSRLGIKEFNYITALDNYNVSFMPYYDNYREKIIYVEIHNNYRNINNYYFIADIEKYMERNNYKNYYIFTKDEYILLPK